MKVFFKWVIVVFMLIIVFIVVGAFSVNYKEFRPILCVLENPPIKIYFNTLCDNKNETGYLTNIIEILPDGNILYFDCNSEIVTNIEEKCHIYLLEVFGWTLLSISFIVLIITCVYVYYIIQKYPEDVFDKD